MYIVEMVIDCIFRVGIEMFEIINMLKNVVSFLFLNLQIAASYGSIVCVFEPVWQPDQKDTSLTVSNTPSSSRCMH